MVGRAKEASVYTKLVGNIITAAEQQTMNFYMNMAQMYKNDIGRRLFAEIGMVEEEHVTQYESLKDPTCTWLEQWVMHEYTECYLYYSMAEDETDEYIKDIWKDHFEMEVAHLKLATNLLEKYEKKSVNEVLPKLEFPPLLKFGENMEYIRKVMQTVNVTSKNEEYLNIEKLDDNDRFFVYNGFINTPEKEVASHKIIEKTINKNNKDYRYEVAPNPIEELRDRKNDNISIGRKKGSRA